MATAKRKEANGNYPGVVVFDANCPEAITKHPDYLKDCFARKDALLERILVCFEENLDSCVTSKNGPTIPKANISELFRLGEESITSQVDIIVDAAAIPLKRILGTVGGFAVCVKNCFLKRNEKGFCFDRKK
ncbi:unnamed protein product [Anisakis simplex]|uniref:ThiF domain-containing protein n=1 Tax=Anisakis simplex TaxID=6269 RepID=A0A0M3KGM3_ANISI|nr:unnamed protein product [Anisakis simplex]